MQNIRRALSHALLALGAAALPAPCLQPTKAYADDGTYGEKGLVTNKLQALIDAGEQYDEVIAIGPVIMMKFVAATTKPYGIKTLVSLNPIMVDGTGM